VVWQISVPGAVKPRKPVKPRDDTARTRADGAAHVRDAARTRAGAPLREPFGFVAATFAVVTWLLLVTAVAASPLFW
jgi:hypothetical protein